MNFVRGTFAAVGAFFAYVFLWPFAGRRRRAEQAERARRAAAQAEYDRGVGALIDARRNNRMIVAVYYGWHSANGWWVSIDQERWLLAADEPVDGAYLLVAECFRPTQWFYPCGKAKNLEERSCKTSEWMEHNYPGTFLWLDIVTFRSDVSMYNLHCVSLPVAKFLPSPVPTTKQEKA